MADLVRLAREERALLADLFAEVGPDRPTLCEGWRTGDLLVHLLIRERRPDAMLGDVVPALGGWSRQARRHYAGLPWSDQVAALRAGPPGWNPTGWGPLEGMSNGAEFFIHHEDVRRGGSDWRPRVLDAPTRDAVVALLRGPNPLTWRLRAFRAGVTAVLDDGTQLPLRRAAPSVLVHGEPAEVLLWLSGRPAGRVRLSGDHAAMRRFRDAGLGGQD